MQEVEDWRIIKDHPLYEVNQYGDIRNRNTGNIKSIHNNKDGYPCVSLSIGGHSNSRSFLVHRLVANAFHDSKEKDLQVNHICAVSNIWKC